MSGFGEMRDCGQVITVWNRYFDESGCDVFIRRVVPVLCKWKESVKRGESRLQAHSATGAISKSLTVIVPYSPLYRSYDVWKAMSDGEKRRYFTFHVSDLLALGEHDVDITGVRPYTETDVRKALGECCAVVSAFADNTGITGGAESTLRRGGHYKVGCSFGFKGSI